MADIVPPEKRSKMMAGIKGKDTKPEMILRKGLHGLGFRYRLHDRNLPGKPDMVFPRYKAVIFAHGCFWHGHSCHLFKWPSSNEEFWHTKIERNMEADKKNIILLQEMGWRTGIVWECALKGKYKINREEVIELCAQWLQTTDMTSIEIGGQC
ncbi:very short patch repair endonuclease [Paenibacillus sp. AK121]|uniref:very short patch repair endonuclease n=1 Tax=Paenibacillus TaxID=44249 RepID=UPI001C22AEBA|nr:very short patch repair endonuclease [Paenibacillus sp. AK121]MBU9706000.1 very short patch repair endonuclease [Paenibacillus sp. AK121]MEE4568139.1 very short patch repair endonuclease [Paenibacillus polymyxa]